MLLMKHYKLLKKLIVRHVPTWFVRRYNIGTQINLCKLNGVIVFLNLFYLQMVVRPVVPIFVKHWGG